MSRYIYIYIYIHLVSITSHFLFLPRINITLSSHGFRYAKKSLETRCSVNIA